MLESSGTIFEPDSLDSGSMLLALCKLPLCTWKYITIETQTVIINTRSCSRTEEDLTLTGVQGGPSKPGLDAFTRGMPSQRPESRSSS